MGTLWLILLPAALFIGGVALMLTLRQPGAVGVARSSWGIPGLWVVGTVALVLLGTFVFPKLLGFTFLFLPFLWMRVLGRRRPNDRSR